MTDSILINYSNEQDGESAVAGYWIRIEQIASEDPLTVEEAAELTDALYDIDPCIAKTEAEKEEEEPVEYPDPPTEEKLYKTAEDIFGNDLEACRSELSGDYTVRADIIRSHLNEQYTLELSSGKVVQTQQIYEVKRLRLIADNTNNVDLKYPVTKSIKLAWIGSVYNETGRVDPPQFQIIGSKVFWEGNVSGVIRAEFTTQFDRVTIDVPGVLREGSELIGDSEPINIVALYHFMMFPATLEPPNDDNGLSKGALLQLCGFMENGELGGVDEGDGTDEPVDPAEPPKYGCQDYSAQLGSASFYEETCCEEGYGPACRHETQANPGGKSISQEDIDYYTKGSPIGPSGTPVPTGTTEFIPVNPRTADGCGKIDIYTEVSPLNCCDDVEVINIIEESVPNNVPPDSYFIIQWAGGKPPFTVTLSNNSTRFSNNKLKYTTYGQSVIIYTDVDFCGAGSFSVTDGCSSDSIVFKSTEGTWWLLGSGDCLFPGCETENKTLYIEDQGFLHNGAWCENGQYAQMEQMVIIKSYPALSPDALYIAGMATWYDSNEGCARTGAQCMPAGTNEVEFHCNCLHGYGFPWIRTKRLCSKAPDPYMSQWGGWCDETMWTDYTGPIGGLYCSSTTHGDVWGSTRGFVGKWYEQSNIWTFIWKCAS